MSLPDKYLTQDQAVEKYSFLSKNMLKNMLFKNIGNFRGKVVRKIGRKIILDETALLLFLSESTENEVKNDSL